jgi:16S rRNA (cytosine967-C5)-methyltransferase
MKSENQHNMSDTSPNGIAARETAVRVLMAVTLKNRPLDLTFDDMASTANLDSRDRAFTMHMVMLTLRRYGSLNHILDMMLDRGLPQNATWTKAAILIGLAQILFMRTADFASAHQMVELVKNLPGKEKGFAGLVNAVLRRAGREKASLLKTLDRNPLLDIPDWLRGRWVSAYGQDTAEQLAIALHSEPMLDISLKNADMATDYATRLEANILPTGSLRRPFADVKSLNGYEDGEWWIQDISASLPAKLFPDLEGKHILDMCAAPGGKTLQLASLSAVVTAIDRSKNRLKRLIENLKRTGLKAEVMTADASTFIPQRSVDHILLDAPCSATGTYRRNPDVMLHKTADDIQKLAKLQSRILEHAFSLLPPEGTLIYCVCSIEPDEGIDQINLFLKDNPKARRLPVTPEETDGLGEIITENGDILCLPHFLKEQGGMDGFYISRLTKQK